MDLKGSIEETSERAKSLKLAIDQIGKSQATVLSDLRNLKEQSSEVKNYLSTVVPSSLSRMLEAYRSGKDVSASPTVRAGTLLPGSTARGSEPN